MGNGILRPVGLAPAMIAAAVGMACSLSATAQPVDPRPTTTDRPPPPPKDGPTTPPPSGLDVYEGRLIHRVVLQRPVKPKVGETIDPKAPERFEALDAAAVQLVMNQLRAREGTPYRQETVTGDISRLNRIGQFSQVENRVQALDDGTVMLIYTLIPRPVVRDVQSVGNKRFTDAEVAAEVEILKNTPVDRYELDRACRRIERLYKEKGYYLAQVEVDQKDLDESGVVLFKIREGERLKVTEIRFEGNKNFSPRELRSNVKSEEAWLLGKGVLDDDQLDLDVSAIINFYRDRGYLDIRASRTVRPSPNGREAVVTFLVDEGQLYTLRDVTVFFPEKAKSYKTAEEAKAKIKPGDHFLALAADEYAVYSLGVFSPEQITGLMEVKPGDVYSVDKLRASLERLRDAYGQLGYTDAEIVRRERRDPDRPVVDILWTIIEKQKYKVGEVVIRKNDITKDSVVRRQVTLKPDRPADTTAATETRDRLRQVNLFDNTKGGPKVTFQDPDPLNPGYRDVLVEVEETNTGNVALGAAVGSDSGVVAMLTLKQRNFDVADAPDSLSEFFSGRAFRGAGQNFVAEIAPGTVSESYSISLADPALFDTDYSGNAGLYYRSRDYEQYDEDRVGVGFGLGRRFGSRWTASVPVRIERINLRGIQDDRPVDYFDVRGANLLTSVGLSLTRSSLNDPFRPSKGSRLSLSADQVGALGGDFTYTSFRAEHSVYLKVNEDLLGAKTVLSLHTRASYVPQNRGEVPVYERFFMGGQGFRGFDYRSVSPVGVRHDTKTLGDDPVGGTWSFFWGAEINQPVYQDTVSVVGFLDTGTVTFRPGFEDYRVSIGVGLRLNFPQLSQVPLAFDFGFPIVSQKTDRERVFTFSLDLPF